MTRCTHKQYIQHKQLKLDADDPIFGFNVDKQ